MAVKHNQYVLYRGDGKGGEGRGVSGREGGEGKLICEDVEEGRKEEGRSIRMRDN